MLRLSDIQNNDKLIFNKNITRSSTFSDFNMLNEVSNLSFHENLTIFFNVAVLFVFREFLHGNLKQLSMRSYECMKNEKWNSEI